MTTGPQSPDPTSEEEKLKSDPTSEEEKLRGVFNLDFKESIKNYEL